MRQGICCPILVSVTHIPELHVLEVHDEGLLIGSVVTIAQLEAKLKEIVKSLPGYHKEHRSELIQLCNRFQN